MKSWTDINVSKKTMTENLKISFFNQDFQNIQIYICEFIVNKQTDLLLETLIELYCDYYSSLNQKTLTKFNTCIDIVKNKNKNLYLFFFGLKQPFFIQKLDIFFSSFMWLYFLNSILFDKFNNYFISKVQKA